MQFAGSSSTGDRRRRRLVVNGDGSAVDAIPIDGDGAEIESQLVASAAAAPWVPVTEIRIWIYALGIGVLLALLTVASLYPIPMSAELGFDRLLKGSRPKILFVTQTVFLGLSTQLGLLIGWYRSRCSLDFGGRYRVWPWAVALLSLGTFCRATDFHLLIGEVIGRQDFLTWRGPTVAWLLPFCIVSLPITLLLDRDVRNQRSSLLTLRFSGLLWLAGALMELYQPELQSRPWFGSVRQILPVFASATLFLGLWLHARIVAYVCPDPPKLDERSAWSLLVAGGRWCLRSLRNWKKGPPPAPLVEDVAKPKRRRKKAEDDGANAEVEEIVVKRKRKPATRRPATRTRTKLKPPDPEIEEPEEQVPSYDESDEANETSEMISDETSSSPYDSSPYDEDEESNQESEDATPARTSASADRSHGNGRSTQFHQSHRSSVPAPHVKPEESSWEEQPVSSGSVDSSNESSEDSDDDQQLQRDSGLTADQMKGLSKRQRRELKKQQRDQERARGR